MTVRESPHCLYISVSEDRVQVVTCDKGGGGRGGSQRYKGGNTKTKGRMRGGKSYKRESRISEIRGTSPSLHLCLSMSKSLENLSFQEAKVGTTPLK